MKQPNWKIPLILSAFLLIFGSFTYWLQYSHKPKQERSDASNKKPLNIPEDAQIAQFRIKGAAQVIEGKCESLASKTCKLGSSGKWSITYPSSVNGDAEVIKDFLTSFGNMTATDTIDLSTETPEKRKALLEEYGLSQEKRTKLGSEFVELTLENGKKLAAWFGEPHPVGDKVFVGSTTDGTLNENTVYLISNFYKGDFDKGLTHFRDKQVMSFDKASVIGFVAQTTQGKLDAQFANGLWTINGKAGDFDRINTLISQISQIKAKDFPEADAYKNARSIARYDLKLKSGDAFVELLEKTTPAEKGKGRDQAPARSRYYARSSFIKETVEVEPLVRSQIDKKVAELRQALILTQTEKATATRIKFAGKAFPTPLEFRYEKGAWQAQDATQKWDGSKIPNLLGLLSEERALDILPNAPAGRMDEITVSIGDEKNPEKAHFLFYTVKDPSKLYAQDLSQKSNEVFLLAEPIKNALPFLVANWKTK